MQRKDPAPSRDPGSILEYSPPSLSELLNFNPKYLHSLTSAAFDFLSDCQTTCSLQLRPPSEVAHSYVEVTLSNAPIWCNATLEQALSRLNSLVEIRNLTVAKVGEKLSLKAGQEFKCEECDLHFPAWADVLQSNKIVQPTKCFQTDRRREVPASKSLGAVQVSARCEGTEFTWVPSGEIYTDFREVKLTDSVNTVTAVILGPRHCDLSEGDIVTVIGAIGLRWLKELVPGSVCEAEYLLKVAGLSKSRKAKIHRGLTNFARLLETLHPFERRTVLLRSSFMRVYQEYDLKLAGLLALTCYLSGSPCSVLVAGPRCTGKSLFLKAVEELGKEQIAKYYRGAVFSPAKLWTVDNFHSLKDRCKLVGAMESTSVFATLTTFHNSETSDKESRKFKALYSPGLTRCSQLCADLDRFDLIVFQHCGHEEDAEYQSRILCDDQMEDLEHTWDLDTLHDYLQSMACPLQEIPLESHYVEELIHNFVGSIAKINMTQTQTQAPGNLSARLVESLIKLSKAHSILLGHRIVTKFDVMSCMMLILQLKDQNTANEYIDEEAFHAKLQEVSRVYTCATRL